MWRTGTANPSRFQRSEIIRTVGVTIVAMSVALLCIPGVQGLQRLQESFLLYDDSASALAKIATASSSLGIYNHTLMEATRARSKDEFHAIAGRLVRYKSSALDSLRGLLASPAHVSRSGRDEGQDLKALWEALAQYFKAAEGVLSATESGLAAGLEEEQRQLMRDLVGISIATDITARYAAVTSGFLRLVITVREVAKDQSEDGQTQTDKNAQLLISGALIVIVLLVGFLYWALRASPQT